MSKKVRSVLLLLDLESFGIPFKTKLFSTTEEVLISKINTDMSQSSVPSIQDL